LQKHFAGLAAPYAQGGTAALLATAGGREALREFVLGRYFPLILQSFRDHFALAYDASHPALQAALWSVAWHTPKSGATILARANRRLKKKNPRVISHSDILRAIYRERARVWQYFRRSSLSFKQKMSEHFKKEYELLSLRLH